MKVSCLQENLAKGLSIVSRAVAVRSTLPVLGNILLATDNGRLKLSATNLEVGITCWVGGQVHEDGATTIPARTFVDLINALPPDQVDMELSVRSQTLHVKCGRFENNVRGIDAQEFPLIPGVDEQDTIHIAPDALRQAIEQVAFAAASDESRPILTGVLAQLKPEGQEAGQGQLILAAADGFRLSVRTTHLDAPVSQPLSVIIPARVLAELGRVIGAGGPQFSPQENPVGVTVTQTKNQVMFRLDNVELVSQLIDGNFPDYTAIIPKKHTTRTVINTAELAKACKAANVFARESANIVRLTISPGGELAPGHVTVAATSAETGDNAGEMDAAVEGDPLEIAFNVKYMLDVLGVVGTSQVALETSASTSPGLLRPVGDDDYIHVIMPMHLAAR
ncbi:MAG: DNA polymerase III subunit beta [Thermoflexales bacterium]|nr:DNA polymerase III subunit beta [Thermoflexales bacterium]